MAPWNYGNQRFDARQLIMQKKQQNGRQQNGRHQGLGLNTNLRNILKAKKNVRNGLQGTVNVASRGSQQPGRLNNGRFELTTKGLVRKTIPVNRNQNSLSVIENRAKKVKLIGSKLIVTKKQDSGAVKMGRNGLPQRVVPNLMDSNMEDEDEEDLQALENFQKARVLKQHLLQSLQERSQIPTTFSLPIPSRPKPSTCAVLVTNLHPSVTEADVIELFSDIGPISNAKLCQPGSAVVVYHSSEDAEKAKDIYHNRQLDGLPMTCVLVPMNQNERPKRGITARLGSKLDSPTSLRLHLPSTSSSIGNRSLFPKPTPSENVVFTVKLQ